MIPEGKSCPEPNGNERVWGTNDTAHSIAIREEGKCPWCGETAPGLIEGIEVPDWAVRQAKE